MDTVVALLAELLNHPGTATLALVLVPVIVLAVRGGEFSFRVPTPEARRREPKDGE